MHTLMNMNKNIYTFQKWKIHTFKDFKLRNEKLWYIQGMQNLVGIKKYDKVY